MIDQAKPFPQVMRNGALARHVHKFSDLDQLQDALKSLVTLAAKTKVVSWTFLPCGYVESDPLPQDGYLIVQVEDAEDDRKLYLPLRDMGERV